MVDASTVTYTAPSSAVTTTVGAALDGGRVSILDFGADPTGVADCTSALDDAVAAAAASSTTARTVYLPTGSYRFASRPAQLQERVWLEGDGSNNTILIRDYSEAGSTADGFISFGVGSSGCGLRRCMVASASGKSGGSLVSIVSGSTFTVGGVVLEDLWISSLGTDTQDVCLFIDGRARTTGAVGVRTVAMRNVRVVGADGYSVELYSVQALHWSGGGVYSSGGTNAASGAIRLSGSSSLSSNEVYIDIESCRFLEITYTINSQVRVGTIGVDGYPGQGYSVNNDSTAVRVAVYSALTPGPVIGSWTSSGIYRPTGWSVT